MANRFGDEEAQQPAATANRFGDAPASAAPNQSNPSMNASISATPKPQGVMGHLERWARNVQDDIKYGTDLTGIGTVLKKMGAHGVYNGAPEHVGDFMASLPLGLTKMVQGGAEVGQGRVLEGGKDVASGAIQAAQIPSAFMGGPEAAEAGQGALAAKALTTTAKAAQKVAEVIPSAERAGGKFSEVMSAAGSVPINVNGPGNTALRIQELAQSGGSMPKVVRDFIKRVTDPEKGPLTYAEARDFYSNATRLSADEMQRLTPVMRRQVGQFTSDLNKSIASAAGQVGKLDQYSSAMNEYHRAMQLRAAGRAVVDAAKSKAAQVAAGTAAGAAGYQLVKKALE